MILCLSGMYPQRKELEVRSLPLVVPSYCSQFLIIGGFLNVLNIGT